LSISSWRLVAVFRNVAARSARFGHEAHSGGAAAEVVRCDEADRAAGFDDSFYRIAGHKLLALPCCNPV